jgi:hypothetical protein
MSNRAAAAAIAIAVNEATPARITTRLGRSRNASAASAHNAATTNVRE